MDSSLRCASCAAVVALAGVASAGVVAEFDLSDHPDGSAAPPTYGLRLDGHFGGGNTVFTFVDVSLTVFADDNDGSLSINISGEVFGGEIVGHDFVDPQSYLLDFNYTTNVEDYNGGWRVTGVNNTDNNGTLTPVGVATRDDAIFTLTDDNNNAFIFAPDGDRIAGDDSTWVGRGWMTTNTDGTPEGGNQDWLFVGTPVPGPGSLALAGLGLLSAARRRRH